MFRILCIHSISWKIYNSLLRYFDIFFLLFYKTITFADITYTRKIVIEFLMVWFQEKKKTNLLKRKTRMTTFIIEKLIRTKEKMTNID